MKARLLVTLRAASSAPDDQVVVEKGIRYYPEGTVIDHPDAYRLVVGGHADPVDDACREKADAFAAANPELVGEMARKHNAVMQKWRAAHEEEIERLEEEEDEDDE